MKKSNELLENLKNKCDFKIYFNGDNLNLKCWKYSEEDNYYHGISNEFIIGRLSITDMKRAIVDEKYFIKLEAIDG